MQRKQISSHEIIRRYREGEHDFSNVLCQNGDFGAINLSGIIFRNSDLSFSGFDGTDLTDADFSDTILDWSSFRLATLRKTNFTGARLQWCALNDAIVDGTIFRKADLSWSIMFNTNRNNADWDGANFVTCAFDPSEITSKGIAVHPSQLERLKDKMPFDIWLRIKFSLQNVTQAFNRAQTLVNVERHPYLGAQSHVGYNIESGGKYSVQPGTGYTMENKYAIDNPYVSSRKKKDLPF